MTDSHTASHVAVANMPNAYRCIAPNETYAAHFVCLHLTRHHVLRALCCGQLTHLCSFWHRICMRCIGTSFYQWIIYIQGGYRLKYSASHILKKCAFLYFARFDSVVNIDILSLAQRKNLASSRSPCFSLSLRGLGKGSYTTEASPMQASDHLHAQSLHLPCFKSD